MSSGRRLRRDVVVALLFVVVALLAVVFPRVYEARYSPEARAGWAAPSAEDTLDTTTSAGSPAGQTTTASPDAAWHPVPTAEQDAQYQRETEAGPRPGAVVAGRDGYLFLGDAFDLNFAQAMGRRYYSRDEVDVTVRTVQAQNRWLAGRGVLGEYVVIPSVWSVYPDKMPPWSDGQVLPRILDQLTAAAPTTLVDLRAPLQAARQRAETYSHLNSHWSDYGALVGFGAIAARIARDDPTKVLPVPTVTAVTTKDLGNEFADVSGAKGPNDWTVPTLAQPVPSYTVVTSDGRRVAVGPDFAADILQMPLQTENPRAGSPLRALVLADSATAALTPFLANAFASTLMVRHHVNDPENNAPNLPALVDSFHPDVVLTLVSERQLNTVTPDGEVWQAAVAYDSARPDPVAAWSPTGSRAVAVSGADITAGVGVVPQDSSPTATVARLEVTSAQAGTMTVSGTTASVAFSRTIRLAQGPNVVFAQVPAGLDGAGLRLAGSAGVVLRALTTRALA